MHDRGAARWCARHARRGDRVAIVTATNEFVTRPIAAPFGVDDLIATELERDAAGRVTGAHPRRARRSAKARSRACEQWLARAGPGAGADFERITFYSDSTNDLPLLERVSHPVATNPGAGAASASPPSAAGPS